MLDIHRMFPSDAEGMESVGELIRTSFQSVADQFDITAQNYPTYPSFLPTPQLASALHSKKVYGYGFYTDSELAGFFMLRQIEEEALCDLSRFCVRPNLQRQGYGSLMLEYAAAAAKDIGSNILHVGVIDPDQKCKDWFQKRGFMPAGSLKYPRVPVRMAFLRRRLTAEKDQEA